MKSKIFFSPIVKKQGIHGLYFRFVLSPFLLDGLWDN